MIEITENLLSDPWRCPDEIAAHLDAVRVNADLEIEMVLAVARSQIGIVGGRCYYRSTGSRPSDPWCVSLVAWCLQKVYGADRLPIYVPTCCSAALRRWARRRGLIQETPQRGDIFLALKHPGGLCYHVGFVEHVVDDDWIIVIDGNGTYAVGAPNAVRRRSRRLSYEPFLFLRWFRDAGDTTKDQEMGRNW